MNRAELELQSIRSTIEGYNQILKDDNVSDVKKKEIKEKIIKLGQIRDKILVETTDYKWGLEE